MGDNRTTYRHLTPLLEAAGHRVVTMVRTPALVVMGANDPDFPDPVAEAQLVAGRLPGTVAMIDQAGHYPQAEYPAETAAAILAFLRAELSTGRS
jgi:pimeloyl-ACP methyl ester carboxylesterase